MRLSLDTNSATYVIRAYAEGEVTINESVYRNSLIVLPDRVQSPWAPRSLPELTAAHMQELLDWKPEIILLGTGDALRFPPPALRALPLQAGIGLEVMDTGSACRTFNILSSEDRRVLAALFMI